MRALRRFAGAEQGGVAMIMAISFLPLLVMVGAAVDLRRVSAAKSGLQQAADSAALAGVDALRQNGNYDAAARSHVDAAFDGVVSRPTTTVTRVNQNTVAVQVQISVPMTMMKMARINEVALKASATATYGAGGGPGVTLAEVALALDTTESMARDGGMATLKTSAKKMIDMLMIQPDGSSNPNVRVGLVPFAKYVNIGTSYNTATWLSGPSWLRSSLTYYRIAPRCQEYTTKTERINKTCYRNDLEPYDCSFDYTHVDVCTREGALDRFLNQWYGCVGSQFPPADEIDQVDAGNPVPAHIVEFNDSIIRYDPRCPDQPLIRLTRDIDRVKSAIDRLTAEGETYIAPGVLWAWRVLSSRPPFADGSALAGVRKSIVLFTDGSNTHSPYVDYDYTVHEGTDVAFANEKLRKICNNAKVQNIQIYTVAFKITDQLIKDRLKACATTPNNYYDASSNFDLESAFSSIGNAMTTIRLVR